MNFRHPRVGCDESGRNPARYHQTHSDGVDRFLVASEPNEVTVPERIVLRTAQADFG